jgi:TRAP-type mannitol/chloroaromatic compound transport system permease large subunit
MPGDFDVITSSAGDMFMGAFVPGLILVGLYMAYILISAMIKPEIAPPVPFEGSYDRKFILRVLLALIPPLTLIFIVLGSIILGVATVNQAGAIGAIGAMIMGSYRLMEGKPRAYYPAFMAISSILAIVILLNTFSLNIKNIESSADAFGIVLACVAVSILIAAIIWSIWRAYTIEDTLRGVMMETAKTTSMVFIILIGAAMLTSAFRGFGGEVLVKDYLTSLPGGFWTQFVVVMAVIFFLGFFLDFIEIAVVVVPIVAPILLADPGANITAVWLGVMIGLNIQTSFLTPPFGFALFYLRGVAPAIVKTLQIYKGAAAFIVLQLFGLAIAGAFPSLVNYLPNKTHLTSETAPPPSNPKLQECLELNLFTDYDNNRDSILSSIDRIKAANISYLPEDYQSRLGESYANAGKSFALIEQARETSANLQTYIPQYRPLHTQVRTLQREMQRLAREISELDEARQDIEFEGDITEYRINVIREKIKSIEEQRITLEQQIPDSWQQARSQFDELASAERKARLKYRRNADESYEPIKTVLMMLSEQNAFRELQPRLPPLRAVIENDTPDEAMATIKALAAEFDQLTNINQVKSKLSKARRALRGNNPDQVKAIGQLEIAIQKLEFEIAWRSRATNELLPELEAYDSAIRHTIGMRLQERLTDDQAENIASCLAVHKDLSLYF